MTLNWTNYAPLTPPKGWSPSNRSTQSVESEAYVVGFIRLIESYFGSAAGWSVRTRDTGHTYRIGEKLADGTYDMQQALDLTPATQQVEAALVRSGVIDGGTFVQRPLMSGTKAVNDYSVSYTAGTGVLAGRPISWQAGKVTCPASDALIYVDEGGQVQARALEAPAKLPAGPQLPLLRTFVNTATFGPGVYSVLDTRTLLGSRPLAALHLNDRVKEAVVQSGPWKGAVRMNSAGYINWYFANMGLLGFIEDLPEIVEAHLQVQVDKFYSAAGTGEADWQTLHGTPWNGQYNWAYDVEPDADGTFTVGVKRRADSHDSYASTFVLLAVAYARVSEKGKQWFTTNIEAIKSAIYFNIATRLIPVPSAAAPVGHWTTVFQDKAVYPMAYAMDNAEVWAALRSANLLGLELGLSPDFFTARQVDESAVLNALQGAWTESDGGKVFYIADLEGGVWGENPLEHFYPDITVHPVVLFFQPPMHSDAAISRNRWDAMMAQLYKLPYWWQTRDYDASPWLYATACAVRLGHHSVGRDGLEHLQRHLKHDMEGSLIINEMGFAKLIEQWLAGKKTGFDLALGQ